MIHILPSKHLFCIWFYSYLFLILVLFMFLFLFILPPLKFLRPLGQNRTLQPMQVIRAHGHLRRPLHYCVFGYGYGFGNVSKLHSTTKVGVLLFETKIYISCNIFCAAGNMWFMDDAHLNTYKEVIKHFFFLHSFIISVNIIKL